jgi:mono/diheme cytochrome c family protein
MVAYADEKPKLDPKALFEQKCNVCHSIDRPMSKRKTPQEWKDTVMRMKNVNGAQLTDQETKEINDYLAKNFGK